MESIRRPLINQIFVVSGVLSTILSCGLGLGYLAVVLDRNILDDSHKNVDENMHRYIETAGEVAFLPSIVVIPYMMQKKGRRLASIITVIPLLFSWLISFDARHFISMILVNILHNISLGGAVTISSVIIAEFCSPMYRGMFLMLETAMISLGVLLSHISGMFNCSHVITTLGILTAIYSLVVTHFWPESPYWLISNDHISKCIENFHWLRGTEADAAKELENLITTHKLRLQLKTLKPIRKVGLKESIKDYIRSLLKADFLKPLSIMILLFSFVGFGGENISSYSLRDIFKLTNGKYIGTIILDVLTLLCSLTACVLIQIVKRKTLFLFTGSFSIIFLGLTSLVLFLQSYEIFSKDYLWLFLSLVTGFVMFMSLGTTALPFSLLGEIFPMSYKGIGSSLTCAYLWAFGNTMYRLTPWLANSVGTHGMLCLILAFMIVILVYVDKIMPETNGRTLLEIEQMMKLGDLCDNYEVVTLNEQDDLPNFDRLRLFIDV